MIKNKSFLDIFWSFADNFLQQIMNFVVGIILGRLLLPEEFGLVGIVIVFITLSNVLVDGGFSSALINKKNTNDIDYNTIFYTNIIISIVLYLLLFLFSDSISRFFNNPIISDLLRVSGLNIVLISLSAIHRVIAIRDLNFKLIAIVSLIAVSISAICAIVMAYQGYGVYSLVYRVLIGQLITVFLFWILNRWKPSFQFSIQSLREMFQYGSNLLLSNLLNTLHSNVYYVVIGKFFTPIDLGYYTRATTFRDLASVNISNTIKRVSFSTLSKIDDAKMQFFKFKFYGNITYLLTSLLMLMLFFLSEEIILILLSNKWLHSADILKIISIAGIFIVLYNLNLDFLAVLGNTKDYLFIEIVSKVLVIPTVIIGCFLGFKIFLYALVVQSLVSYFYVCFKFLHLKLNLFKQQFFMLVKFAVILLTLITIDYFKIVNISNIYMSLLVKIIIVFTLYILVNLSQLKTLYKSRV